MFTNKEVEFAIIGILLILVCFLNVWIIADGDK